MNETTFINSARPRWLRLQELGDKLESAPHLVDEKEFEEFMTLYRLTVSDLAKAQAESSNPDLIELLNVTVTRAYAVIYRPRPRSGLHLVKDWLIFGAQAFRRQFRFILASLFIVLFFVGFSATMLQHRPDLRGHFISPSEEALFDQWKQGEFEYRDIEGATQMWAFYATNNPLVTVRFAASGASTFGIFTFQGMRGLGTQLGALGYEMNTVGKLPFLLSSIAPHGASELSGAVISGAVGFLMGWTLLFPGRRTRLQAIKHVANDAFALFVMAVLMMYIAAPFEGYFSFRPEVPQVLKGIVGGIIFIVWCCYWGIAGRTSPQLFIPAVERPSEEESLLPTGVSSSTA